MIHPACVWTHPTSLSSFLQLLRWIQLQHPHAKPSTITPATGRTPHLTRSPRRWNFCRPAVRHPCQVAVSSTSPVWIVNTYILWCGGEVKHVIYPCFCSYVAPRYTPECCGLCTSISASAVLWFPPHGQSKELNPPPLLRFNCASSHKPADARQRNCAAETKTGEMCDNNVNTNLKQYIVQCK